MELLHSWELFQSALGKFVPLRKITLPEGLRHAGKRSLLGLGRCPALDRYDEGVAILLVPQQA